MYVKTKCKIIYFLLNKINQKTKKKIIFYFFLRNNYILKQINKLSTFKNKNSVKQIYK